MGPTTMVATTGEILTLFTTPFPRNIRNRPNPASPSLGMLAGCSAMQQASPIAQPGRPAAFPLRTPATHLRCLSRTVASYRLGSCSRLAIGCPSSLAFFRPDKSAWRQRGVTLCAAAALPSEGPPHNHQPADGASSSRSTPPTSSPTTSPFAQPSILHPFSSLLSGSLRAIGAIAVVLLASLTTVVRPAAAASPSPSTTAAATAMPSSRGSSGEDAASTSGRSSAQMR